MKLRIEVDIISTVPEEAEHLFAKTVVNTLTSDAALFSSIANAFDEGSKYGTASSLGRISINIDKDSPSIYGIRL